MAAIGSYKIRVEGMDCAACALKIENALRRLPGASLGTGALFLLALTLSYVMPEWERWLYSATALISLLPFGRRALAGALSGSPFTIETLMAIAALGAVAIGEAEEAAVDGPAWGATFLRIATRLLSRGRDPAAQATGWRWDRTSRPRGAC